MRGGGIYHIKELGEQENVKVWLVKTVRGV